MKTTSQKNSFGGGYGINRNVGGANALTVAEPAMKGVARHPGSPNRKEIGQKGLSSFMGAKIYRNKSK